MKQYTVTGMSCAACERPGGKGSLPCGRCGVLLGKPFDKFHGSEGDVKDADIIAAVEQAGYGAEVKGMHTAAENQDGEEAGARQEKRC